MFLKKSNAERLKRTIKRQLAVDRLVLITYEGGGGECSHDSSLIGS